MFLESRGFASRGSTFATAEAGQYRENLSLLTFLKQSQSWVLRCTLFFVTRFDVVGYRTAAWVACNSVFLCLHYTGDGEVAALMRRTAL